MSLPVFRIDPDLIADASVGECIILDGTEGRHAATVRRIGVGEGLEVTDGQGTRLRCDVVRVEGERLELVVLERYDERAPQLRLVLVQALAKAERDLQAVEAATELGVDAVIPWQAERSIVRWKPERAAKAAAKWSSTIDAATKQSRRARTPQLEELVSTRSLARRLERPGSAAIVLHEDAQTALVDVLAHALGGSPEGGPAGAHELLIVVGPEGGISASETEQLRAAGASLAVLGSTVLRSSTAGPAALAVISERCGRWAVSAP